jgi:thioredoxin-like negative regulator of GroEL/predicted aspartyl protease
MRLSLGIMAICTIILCVTPAHAFQTAAPDLAGQARSELFAGRNGYAATLYQKLVDQEPTRGDAYYGLVRALLRDQKSHDAYTAAKQGLEKAPQTSSAQAAAGMAAFRQGEIGQAEQYFRAAYKIDPKDPSALVGLASIYSMVSKFKTARDLRLEAYRYAPDDPALMMAKANSLKGAEHIAALEKILAIYDPETDEARGLRAHIATDRAIGDRKIRRLTSPYESVRVKLVPLWNGPKQLRGMGLRVRFNERENATLLLDTGASGMSLSPKLAEKAGLEVLGRESSEAKGVGDERGQDVLQYLAPAVQIGDVTFENYPVAVFRSAKSGDYDGLIGTDVFARFLVGIDFVKTELTLDPFPKVASASNPSSNDDPEDAGNEPAPGFYRAFRFGNHLTIFTNVNDRPAKLFLIDSGSSSNLIDEAVAREAAAVSGGSPVVVRGIQGKVDKTSMAMHVSLVFAGLRQDNPNLIAINFDKIDDSEGVGMAGIIGMPVLVQLKLTIDYRNGTVRMEYKKP